MVITGKIRNYPLATRGFTLVELLAAILLVGILAMLLISGIAKVTSAARDTKCGSNLRQIGIAARAYSADHNGEFPPSYTGKNVFSDALIPYVGKVPGRDAADFMNSPFICPSAKVDRPDDNYSYRGIYTPSSFIDPTTGKTVKYGLSYGQNAYAVAPSDAHSAYEVSRHFSSRMMLCMDYESQYIVSIGGFNDATRRIRMEARHNKKLNTLFVDGSVRPIFWDDIPKKSADMPCAFWQGVDSNQ